MKELLFCILSIMSFSTAYAVTYPLYQNARFNYQIAYPDILKPQPESENGDGRIIKNNNAKLIVWGSHMPQTLSESLTNAKSDLKDYKINYQLVKSNYFILSGESETMIAYFKTIFVCGENINFQLYYPKQDKPIWDNAVNRIGNSFKYSSVTCRKK